MKDTPLVKKHEILGAKMAAFAGYNMPISYAGIKAEHKTVREAVGVFDVSHMGEFIVKGSEALDLIQKVTSNDASKLEIGKIQYSCFPNGKGGIVDDLLVYKLADNEYMLVVNASNMDKDWNWIKEQNTFDAQLENVSDDFALLAVQGPKAAAALQALTDVDLASVKYYTFTTGTFAGLEDIILSATGYTGSGGFELYIPSEKAAAVWDKIFEAGKDFGIEPIGLGARDTLRLEMGYCLYGNDIDDTTSPLEAGLGWITKLNKGDFIDADYLKNQKAEGTSRRLIGFEMIDRGIPRHDYLVEDADGNEIGKVTSGTQAPSLDKAIGMAYVNKPFDKAGTEIFIAIRNKKIKAMVTKLPFYKN